jgi:hypothetical protein
MLVSEGVCIHCSAEIFWDREQACYVSTSPGGPDLPNCGGVQDMPHHPDLPEED